MFNRMKIYTVHVRPGEMHAPERPVFVKEGFNWLAFVFPLIWTLYHRLWIAAVGIAAFVFVLLLILKDQSLSPGTFGILYLGMHIMVAFHAGDWLRAALTRRGYILTDISAGESLLRAEQRYFERYLAVA